MSRLVTRAPAKVNLSLHILGRREGDGYHELESLVAFTGSGDTLILDPGSDLALTTSGPTAGPAGPLDDNLVIRAARHLASAMPNLHWGHFHLVKRLPVAAGIGGGSSDAAAALRLLARHNDLAITHPAVIEAARRTGADVPVCLEPRARMMCGAGESVGEAVDLPPLPALLINPGVAVSTAPVFRALGLAVGARHPGLAHPAMTTCSNRDAVIAALEPARNDLEAPALTVAPVIGAVLETLRGQPGCRLARMSGSGATAFGLFSDRTAAVRAARRIRAAEAGWWVKPVVLR
ncbi:MAG: 4-(cytidine 5'-diphospho)-2-C-methyl-D-erythritol kinase [Methylobacterium sp.]|uniref:4-(cytidine 5'-diphospho)-2-C-methyl-D-erythritol kinase n=1 Tax=Methylobacterium sp. TaxID=409 RepID=UPI0025D20AB5|nr:4-(cytidine 5'-diphospho)-2-C-methyl-D-erythritol kinase [Methylobacterium sp.]MBX9930752.1 4-(cytidine 5'-diphospho)-2-C-methyl-D-erythritol kinase [Methylobacterium sp.]